MATTTNFGWETPDDSDLVKDGALAMRTLGNAIDTSLVDLRGGTTGQNLRKNSNTDMDFVWAGDATNTVVDAAGDLLYGTAADTLGRLAIGTAGQVLKVNSGGTAPEWGAASSTPTFVGCSVYKNATQSIANATQTAVTWQVEDFDTDSFHSTSTNTSRMTIPTGKDGKYLITVSIGYAFNATGRRAINFYKNGSSYKSLFQVPPLTGSGSTVLTASNVLSLVAGDYVEIYVYQDSGGSLNLNGASQDEAAFAITYLGA